MSTDLPSAIDRLVAIEEIKRLKAVYCRAVDSRDWSLFESVFASDAVLDFRGAATTSTVQEPLFGASTIIAAIRKGLEGMTTVHQCHTPEIEITSSTTASAIWHMADILRWPKGSPVTAKNGYGYYHETYSKTDGQWKIKTTKLTRILNEVVRP